MLITGAMSIYSSHEPALLFATEPVSFHAFRVDGTLVSEDL